MCQYIQAQQAHEANSQRDNAACAALPPPEIKYHATVAKVGPIVPTTPGLWVDETDMHRQCALHKTGASRVPMTTTPGRQQCAGRPRILDPLTLQQPVPHQHC